jgi:CHAT domain-containing protein
VFGGNAIHASTIAQHWRMDGRPRVILAACEAAANQTLDNLTDEYFGLDRAFKIAGAREIIAALWPVEDHFSALASFILTEWQLHQGVSGARALAIFQANLRRSEWKTWMPTEKQLNELEQKSPSVSKRVRDHWSMFRDLDKGAFADARHWSAFRCYQ